MCDAGSRQALEDITQLVNQAATTAGRPHKTVEDVALGFIDVANEAMCRPIRSLTEARGFDASQHVLACFGGAGGQHACAIARQLGMKTVFVHRYASILSAVGMGLASVVQEAQVQLHNCSIACMTAVSRYQADSARQWCTTADTHQYKYGSFDVSVARFIIPESICHPRRSMS